MSKIQKNIFSIYFTNDLHSNIPNGVDLFVELFKKKSPCSLVIDSGDFIEGSPFYNLFNGIPEKKIIKNIYDIVIPGNHGFSDFIKLNKSRDNNILNANIYFNGRPFFRPYHIINAKNYKIGLVGIMSEESFYAIEVEKRKKFKVLDPLKILKSIIPKLRTEVDYLLVLSHSGIEFDKKIAKAFGNVDMIIGGHCHSKVYDCTINGVKIRKAIELGRGFGEIKIDIKKHKIFNKSFKINNKQQFFRTPELFFLNDYLRKYYLYFSKKVFFVSKHLCSNLGNRKLLMEYFVKKIRNCYNADECVINYSCLRDILYHGNNTLEDIYKVIPFDNELVCFNIEKEKIDNIVNSMDPDIKKFLCIDKKYVRNKKINVITSSYLFNNIFNRNNNFKYKKVIKFREFILKYLK